jgi:hypothetical protein
MPLIFFIPSGVLISGQALPTVPLLSELLCTYRSIIHHNIIANVRHASFDDTVVRAMQKNCD